MTGIICGVVSPQRPSQLTRPLSKASHDNKGTAGLSFTARLLSYRTDAICGVITPKGNTDKIKSPRKKKSNKF